MERTVAAVCVVFGKAQLAPAVGWLVAIALRTSPLRFPGSVPSGGGPLRGTPPRVSIRCMERIRIASINIGIAGTIDYGNRRFVTGIDKQPVEACVAVTPAGLDGDRVCDTEHHGGADQAVYVYSVADYEWWAGELGRRLRPGTFGDNLTIDGLPPDMNVGDRLLIGSTLLEATAPRIPCSTLAATMGDSEFGLAFRRAEKPGVYFRVLNEGEICPGDRVTLVENTEPTVSVLMLFRLCYDRSPAREALQAALGAPIAERLRQRFEAKLAALPAA